MPHLLPAAASAIAQTAPAAAAAAAKATVMGTLKSVAFNALTSLAISSALSVFSTTVGASARQVEFVIDPDGPIPFAAGRVGVSGSVVHRDTFGPDLMYYGIPFVLSGAGPITAIESFMADDYPMAFDANGGAVTEPYRQELFFRSVLGFQPAPVALSTPGGLKKGATLPGWTGAHKLSGKAAGLIVMAENSKGSAFPTGEIKPLIQLLGLKGWDPTLDSTYPGGDGPCRLNDASTWVTLTCPILWGLKWALGLWEGPSLKGAPAHDSLTDHQVGGIGVRLSGVDVPAFVSASNIAKANGWTVSAYPNTDDDKHQVLETFLQPGATYFIAIQYQRNQNYSEREVFGPFTAPELVASDVSPTAPTIVAMQDAIDLAEEGIGSINTAVASLNATVYTAGTGLKARSDAMFASLNTPTTGVLARLTATETAVSTNNSAAVERLNALEATVNTAGTGLTARLATAESAITANNNAATSRLSALEATVNTAGTGLSARVAGLQTAVSDLNTGRANASDLTALQTEVTTARGGAASLNTRLNTVESTVAGKASASSVSALEATVGAPGTGLLARTGAAENAIVSLQSGKADASRVTLVEASAAAALNGSALNKNSTFAMWPTGQALPNNVVTFGSGLTVSKGAGRVSLNAPVLEVASGVSNAGIEFPSAEANWNGPLPTANGQTSYWAVDYKIEVGSPNLGSAALRFLLTNRSTGANASDQIVRRLYELHTSTGDDQIVEGSFLVACSPTVAAPAYSARLAFFARTDPIASYGRYIPHRVAVRPALPSEIASGVTLPSVTARVGVLETATTNLQTQKADASRVTSLEATVNTPGTGVSARLTTVESVAASADGRAKAIKGVVLDVNGYVSGYSSTNDGTSAAFEVSADKFGIRAPGSGERTEYRAGNWYVYSPSENTRTRYGKAFGGDQKLVWWTGPTSVAEGSETKGNAYVYMSQNTVGGPRFGGSDVIGPGGTLTATASTGFIGGGRSGAGYVNTSNQVTVTVSGGTSGATIRWTRISGDSRIQMNNATAFTTGAYATIGAGEVISAYFMGSITKGGQSAVVYVQVDLSDNGT